jgi:hypothetical protein
LFRSARSPHASALHLPTRQASRVDTPGVACAPAGEALGAGASRSRRRYLTTLTIPHHIERSRRNPAEDAPRSMARHPRAHLKRRTTWWRWACLPRGGGLHLSPDGPACSPVAADSGLVSLSTRPVWPAELLRVARDPQASGGSAGRRL